MKIKHNKKRNTAFLYEITMRELVKNILCKNNEVKNSLIEILKEHFGKNSILRKELSLYMSLYDTNNLRSRAAENLLNEVKARHEKLNKEELFLEQSVLIKKLSKASDSIFSNFIPNYKSIATIYQMFNVQGTPKEKILLEQTIFNRLIEKNSSHEELKPIDNLTYQSFVKRFNEKYNSGLLREQKELLSKYISSFVDNGLEFKIYLNEEIGRLKNIIEDSLNTKEIREDKNMFTSTKKILNIIENFKTQEIKKDMIKQVLKIQNLVKEIQN